MNRRPYRRLRPVTATFALVAFAAGCTSILGDFTVSNNGGGGNDAGSGDGSAGDGASSDGNGGPDSTPSDAPLSDAPDAADFFVKCDGFSLPKNIVVESLITQSGANRTYSHGPPAIVTISDSVVHIVSYTNSFTFFTINKQNPQFSGSTVQPLGDQAQEVIPIRNGTGIMTTHNQSFFNYLGAFLVPGTQPAGGQLPPAFTFEQLPNNALSRFSSAFLEFSAGRDYYYAYTNQPNASAALHVGRTINDAGTSSIVDNNSIGGASPILMRAGSSVYVYLSGDPSSGGAVSYKLPDDGTTPPGTVGRKLTGTVTALMIAAAPSPTPNQYDIAMIEFDPNSTTALATTRIGSVDGAKLDTFKGPDLPKGLVINDTAELPIDKGRGAWFGDEFTMIGKGSPATFPGINFMWFDAQGHLRARHTGANALLTPKKVGGAAVALNQRIGNRYVTFNIVWTETLTDPDGGGDYDVMYLNELICH